MQPASIDVKNFFIKYGELMSGIARAQMLYGTDLREVYFEASALYWRLAKDLMSRKLAPDSWNELRRLEFSVYKRVCEDIIKRSSEFVDDLDRLFFVDTSELSVAIRNTKLQKIEIERDFIEREEQEKSIKAMKDAVDNLFKVYSDWEVQKQNKERKAITKWGGVFLGVYGGAMFVYFQILNNMNIKSDFVFGVAIPVGVALFMVLLLLAILSRE